MDGQSSVRKSGRHFLQIPGPTNVPDRILRAIDRPTIDHRGPEFSQLGRECLEGMKRVFQTTKGHVFIYPSSGTGAGIAVSLLTSIERRSSGLISVALGNQR
jgi:aspartate aminotransferase-like enzyme